MKSLTILFLAALAFLCLFVADLHATHPVCIKQVQQVVQPVLVPQNVYVSQYYRVGEQLIVPELVAELRALRAEVQALKVAPQTAPQTAPQAETAPAPTSMIAQKCAKCHTGNTPKGGLFLDGQTELGCSSITEALRKIAAGTMPPPESGVTLTPQEKGQLMQELLDLESSEP